MNITYKSKSFSKTHFRIIDQTIGIIEEYDELGIDSLTLRQVYYQFVGRDLFPDSRRWSYNSSTRKWYKDPDGTSNTQQNYKWLGGILTAAKLAGALSWRAISDLTRSLKTYPSWDDPSSIINASANQFQVDLWEGQPNRVYVWIEKDAGLSLVSQACRARRVPYMSTRGFSSMQVLHDEAMRHKRLIERGINPVVILITDHDPSGMAMLPDIENRFETFDVGTTFTRIALTMKQIEQYNLPADPAKLSDSRGQKYIDRYGEHAYELDALSADVLLDLIEREINNNVTDEHMWRAMRHEEDDHKAVLRQISWNYQEIADRYS